MKAVINLDVPDWQIGQPVTVYFPDTMCKTGTCEADTIVRCKDCKHYWEGYCEYGTEFRPQLEDFFCADGKQK